MFETCFLKKNSSGFIVIGSMENSQKLFFQLVSHFSQDPELPCRLSPLVLRLVTHLRTVDCRNKLMENTKKGSDMSYKKLGLAVMFMVERLSIPFKAVLSYFFLQYTIYVFTASHSLPLHGRTRRSQNV